VARIAEAELERVKREVAIATLAESRGVVLTPHGADLIGRCPFHDDREPSLVITPAKNLWHCLGACQRGGSVIDWVMQAEGLSFRHAVEVLRGDAGAGAAAAPPGRVKRSTVTRLAAPIARDAADHEVLQQVVAYYHATLQASPEALGYLERRGLRAAELIEHFQLGFANRTLGYRLPARNRQTGAALRGRLEHLGLLRASGHEHFNGALVVPTINEAGQVVELYGRRLTDPARPGVPRHLYLPGPLRGVFNVAALAGAAELILCEALLDALTFWGGGLSGGDGELRRGGFHGRASDDGAASRDRTPAHRLRCGRGGRSGGRSAGPRAGAARDRVRPAGLPPRPGRQRLRAHGGLPGRGLREAAPDRGADRPDALVAPPAVDDVTIGERRRGRAALITGREHRRDGADFLFRR
jgi:hypothetical protein